MVRFNPYSYEFHDDPFPVYRDLRDNAPCYHNADLGFWAISRYDDRQPFRAWLFRILVNRCRTLALQRSRRGRRFPHDELALVNATAPDVVANDREDAIRRAVDELEPLLREAFLLKYVEGMEYHEMASALGAGISALKMRVKRACEALRDQLGGLDHDR